MAVLAASIAHVAQWRSPVVKDPPRPNGGVMRAVRNCSRVARCPVRGAAVGYEGVRASGGHPSHRPAVVHRARTAESLTRRYRESCAIVWRHYRRPLTVAAVARALASSPRQVQRAFVEVGETSLSAYLREVRLRHAAQLLREQPLTVRQRSGSATASPPRATASAHDHPPGA
jgi:AraC-like DNA-binding protein